MQTARFPEELESQMAHMCIAFPNDNEEAFGNCERHDSLYKLCYCNALEMPVDKLCCFWTE